MYLFIFESIGTQELILIGLVALIFLGPRRLPEIARKLGKTMADLRNTTNDFRQTWEREVDFEEEKNAFKVDTIEEEVVKPVAREKSIGKSPPAGVPEVRSIDPAEFDMAATANASKEAGTIESATPTTDAPSEEELLSDKRSWL